MKRILFALLALSALSGCATMDGIGQDISSGAQRVATWF